jgi:GNAT superfamily N-acetyltransferase
MDTIARLDIRPARREDLPALLALYGQLNPDDPAIEERHAVARFQEMVDHPGMTIFIACANGPAVSSVTLVVIPNLTRSARPYALIENVVTHADHRRQGYARALIEKAIAAAWDQGCFKVMLLTGSTEAATLRFYANCGFSQNKTGFQIRQP